MPLSIGVDEYMTLPLESRREFDAWLEEVTSTSMQDLMAMSVTLVDEGGLIEIERASNPLQVTDGEVVTKFERFAASEPPPHFVAT